MTGLTANYIEQLLQHLEVLQEYARRVIIKGESLTRGEDADRAQRMRWLLEIGASLSWSEKDIIGVLYGDLFSEVVD